MTCYVGLTALAGFAKGPRRNEGHQRRGQSRVRPLSPFNYLLSWLLAIVYGRIARSKFDPLAARAALDASERVLK